MNKDKQLTELCETIKALPDDGETVAAFYDKQGRQIDVMPLEQLTALADRYLQMQAMLAAAKPLTVREAEALEALHDYANQDGDFDEWHRSAGSGYMAGDLRRAMKKIAAITEEKNGK